MKRLGVIIGLGCALALPTRARAEPISATVFSSTSGATADASAFVTAGTAIDLGTLSLSGGSSTVIRIDGLQARANVPVTFTLIDSAVNPFTAFTVEILDPL